ncbi:hypothetical protein [Yinghuangia sp. YIM S10712]|uniref:hypothetical protein n=1 Tax=Yinghuangia sp. YIM S10712 TaxID=3436930 RepID=UPI003F52B559
MSEAKTVAAAAEVAVVALMAVGSTDDEGADRASFELPAGQNEFVRRVCAANPRAPSMRSHKPMAAACRRGAFPQNPFSSPPHTPRHAGADPHRRRRPQAGGHTASLPGTRRVLGDRGA